MNKYVYVTLLILCWILFVGLSIEAGGYLTNYIANYVFTPEKTKHLWIQTDLSLLYAFDKFHFVALAFIICTVAVLKAYLFYVIINALHKQKPDFQKPFTEGTYKLTKKLAELSLVIGLLANAGVKYIEHLNSLGVSFLQINKTTLSGSDVWIFMSIILFVVTFLFKKGIEIQNENDLTI